MFVNCEDTFFVNLIPRLYDVCGGAVKIAGVDVRDFDLTYLREQTGVVTQYLINLRRTASESGAQFQAITKSIA